MLVSIIIPCYNVEAYIKDCMASAQAQLHQELEIIIVDNNSTDRTLEFVKTFEQENAYPVKIIYEPKQSAQAARNAGLHEAKGTWIQFLDADDLLHPNKIKHQLDLIQNQNVPFIAGAFERLLLTGEREKQRLWTDTYPLTAVMMSRGFLGITSSNLWHRYSLLHIKGWNENLKAVHEYDLMFRLLQKNENIIYDNQIHTVIRERVSGQISQQNPIINYKHSLQLQTNILDYLRHHKTDFLKENESLYFQLFISHLRTMSRYDYDHAKNLLIKYWPKKTMLQSSKELPIIEKWYALLFNALGFDKVEYLKKVIRRY